MHHLSDIEIIGLGIYFRKYSLLAIADIHIGYDEALNKQGILVPRIAFKEMIKKAEEMFVACCKKTKTKKLKTILINGDLKHEFGIISETEWRHTVRFLKLLQEYSDRIILIKGNHDTILRPIAAIKGLEILEHYILNDTLFVHGDSIPDIVTDKKIKTVILGHEHPAVSLSQWPRVEKYKAILVGKWRTKTLIVLPSFNLIIEGKDVLKEKPISPFLSNNNLLVFDCYIIGDKSYFFGKLKNLKIEKQKN